MAEQSFGHDDLQRTFRRRRVFLTIRSLTLGVNVGHYSIWYLFVAGSAAIVLSDFGEGATSEGSPAAAIAFLMLMAVVPPLLTVGALAYRVKKMPQEMLRGYELGDSSTRPRNLVDNLWIFLGQQLGSDGSPSAPTVIVIKSNALNAWSTGKPGKSIVVLTDRLVEELGRAELEAIVAHQLLRIRSGSSYLVALCGLATANAIIAYEAVNSAAVGAVALSPRMKRKAERTYRRARALRRYALIDEAYLGDLFAIRVTQNDAAILSAMRRMAGDSAIPEQVPVGFEHLWFNAPPRQRATVPLDKQQVFDELDAMSPRATLTQRIRRIEQALNLPESKVDEIPSDELPAAMATTEIDAIEMNNYLRFNRVPPSAMHDLARLTTAPEIEAILKQVTRSDSPGVANWPTQSPAGWHPDPWQHHSMRWWDGSVWTGWTHDHPTQTPSSPV